jgi:hypothetical protein
MDEILETAGLLRSSPNQDCRHQTTYNAERPRYLIPLYGVSSLFVPRSGVVSTSN